MIVLSGADLVLPDRILSPGTIVIDGGRIVDIRSDAASGEHPSSPFPFHNHYIVPGFIDVHVHGVGGIDALDAGDAIARIAARLPPYGVTAFCPTTVACGPGPLRRALAAKLGIARYGFLLPMDESEAQVALDLSGRPFAQFSATFRRDEVGGFPTELVPHFFRSLGEALGAAIHVKVTGENTHHMIEACFKGVGRALRDAIRREGLELPSTKGLL